MATIASVLKDQLAVYDHKLQELNKTIDWAYSEIGKVQAARLKLMELMEEALGTQPEDLTRVVVQKMAFVGAPEPQRLIDDGEQSRIAKYGTEAACAERKKARDAAAYLRRKAKKQRTLMAGGWASKIIVHLKDAPEPLSLAEIAAFHGIPAGDAEERSRLRSALGRLKQAGVITNPPGEPQGTGHPATYLLVGRPLTNGAAHP